MYRSERYRRWSWPPLRELASRKSRKLLWLLPSTMQVNVHTCIGGTLVGEDISGSSKWNPARSRGNTRFTCESNDTETCKLGTRAIKTCLSGWIWRDAFVGGYQEQILWNTFRVHKPEYISSTPCFHFHDAAGSSWINMPQEVHGLATPIRILVRVNEEVTLEGIRQFYVAVDKDRVEAWNALWSCHRIQSMITSNSVIFTCESLVRKVLSSRIDGEDVRARNYHRIHASWQFYGSQRRPCDTNSCGSSALATSRVLSGTTDKLGPWYRLFSRCQLSSNFESTMRQGKLQSIRIGR